MKLRGGAKRILKMIRDGWTITVDKGYDLGSRRAWASKAGRTIVVRYRHAQKARKAKALEDLRAGVTT